MGTKGLTLALASVLFLSLAGFGEAAPGQQPAGSGAARSQFDPRDLSGIWLMAADKGVPGSLGPDIPPMTPEGKARFSERRPTGNSGNSSLSNDPVFQCNPMGFPRLVLGGGRQAEPIEFIHTEGRLLQLFQWEGVLRELWIDGRELPQGETLAKLGPAWYGHSVGSWHGDTIVVTTVGLDERAWLNARGYPYSSSARFEERYKRVNANTIEFQMILWDPKTYTSTWVGETKIFRRIPREDTTFFGWYGLFSGISEGICAPLNEVDGFNKAFRDPSNAQR